MNVRRTIVGLVLALAAGAHAELEPAQDADAQLGARRSEVQSARAEKAVLDRELASLPERERALTEQLTRDVRTLYRLQRGGLMPLVSGLDAWMAHASRVTHFKKVTGRTLDTLTHVRGERARIEREMVAIDARVTAAETALHDAERAQQELAQAAAARMRAESLALPAQDAQPRYGLTLSGGADPGLTGERFTDMVGGLALPLAGSASIADADRPAEDPNPGSGLSFTGKVGASVRAAAAGRVTYAGRHPHYGLMVVVEHDHRYQTVYGGLGSIEVQGGDAISKSARLGAAGSAPVYFEVRRGTRSQDSRRWLGL